MVLNRILRNMIFILYRTHALQIVGNADLRSLRTSDEDCTVAARFIGYWERRFAVINRRTTKR